MRPGYVENETLQVTNAGERDFAQLSHEGDKKGWRDEKTANQKRELPIAPTHHAGLATIPSSLLRVVSVRRLDSPCPWDLDQNTGERNCCVVEVTSKEILYQKRALPPRGRDVLVQDVLPTSARIAMTWPY